MLWWWWLEAVGGGCGIIVVMVNVVIVFEVMMRACRAKSLFLALNITGERFKLYETYMREEKERSPGVRNATLPLNNIPGLSLQMNTAIELTYNINATAVSLCGTTVVAASFSVVAAAGIRI